MNANANATQRDLVIESIDCTGFVEIGPDDTLADLRTKIEQDFDEDMKIPEEYCFLVQGIRYSTKQESRKRAWDLARVSIRPRTAKRPRLDAVGANANAAATTPAVTLAAAVVENSPKDPPRVLTENTNHHANQSQTQTQSHLAAAAAAPMTEDAATTPAPNTTGTGDGDATTVTKRANLGETTVALVTQVKEGNSKAVDVDMSRRMLQTEFDQSSPKLDIDTGADGGDDDRDDDAMNAVEDSCIVGKDLFPVTKDSLSTKETATTLPGGRSAHTSKTPMMISTTTTSKETTAMQDLLKLMDDHDEEDKPTIKMPGSPSSTSPPKINSAKSTSSSSTPAALGAPSPTPDAKTKPASSSSSSLSHHDDTTDPHKRHDAATHQSQAVLSELSTLLTDHPLFCNADRRADWTAEIKQHLDRVLTGPRTVVGVLGNTGVGKSSLLNALLDEASVLPTSGSRGCTAAVVELRFNPELRAIQEQTLAESPTSASATATATAFPLQPKQTPSMVPAYKGEIEFIRLHEWTTELKLLVEECSTNGAPKKVYARCPDADSSPDAAEAWSKINQVYGSGTMETFCGRPADHCYQRLSTNQRVVQLLTPSRPGQNYNSILVQEGMVDAAKARALLCQTPRTNTATATTTMRGMRLQRETKKWAQSFRSKINDYVYRKGNGSQPQTWPLLRKVVLYGPWSVLSTGATLVDLPGVRDANAARAKVSEQYLQHCNLIWIVAPIKRAVDDGTAKELLGEQFKRRLLMDGQYGNVSFICTQTDDCEATEILRDHADVAMTVPGRWETMTRLRDEILEIESKLADAQQVKEEHKIDYEEALEELKEAKVELEQATKEMNDEIVVEEEDEEGDVELRSELTEAAEKRVQETRGILLSWTEANEPILARLQTKCERRQMRLKALCAIVRNEYSKGCLQADFKSGLKELVGQAEDDTGVARAAGAGTGGTTAAANITHGDQALAPIPDDFEMHVSCISANDYLKLQGIKASSDGRANTFASAEDTQIPSLRRFVHEKTAEMRNQFTEQFVNATSDLVDRVKLLAAGAQDVPSGKISRKAKAIFDAEMVKLEFELSRIGTVFTQKAGLSIKTSLLPSLQTGAAKGKKVALSTVDSWGSKSRRRKNDRGPHNNGLHFMTYGATVRREGVYTSPTAGAIDLNQELCDPMEKEFGADWQQTMDASLKVYLRQSESQALQLGLRVDKSIVQSLQAAVAANHLATMSNAGTRSCNTAVKQSFQDINSFATDQQRDLNRSLLPLVQARMHAGYANAAAGSRGSGMFQRMKNSMSAHAQSSVNAMFDDSTREILASIDTMIQQINVRIRAVPIRKHLEQVYSTLWDDHGGKNHEKDTDPAVLEKVRQCRDSLLPVLNQLRQRQDDTMRGMGMEREEPELDVLAVASLDTRLENMYQKALAENQVIDLCDSDAETNVKAPSEPSALAKALKVKKEPISRRGKKDPDRERTIFKGALGCL